MMSQTGASVSLGRPGSAPAGRLAGRAVTSAILTYFGLIVTKSGTFAKGSCGPWLTRPRKACPSSSPTISGVPAGRKIALPERHRGSPNRVRVYDAAGSARSEPGELAGTIWLAEENAMEQPFDRRDGFIWYDGKLVPWAGATLHVLSHGLHYASCVFEGERAYGGVIFRSTSHSERLRRSAELLDFEIPYSVAEIDAAKHQVLERNGQKDAYVRPVAWRGSEMMGVSAQHNKIHVAIATWEWPSYYDPAQRLKGIRIDLAEYRRPDPATIPAKAKAAGLYMICTISKHRAERKGYADALMLDWRGLA